MGNVGKLTSTLLPGSRDCHWTYYNSLTCIHCNKMQVFHCEVSYSILVVFFSRVQMLTLNHVAVAMW